VANPTAVATLRRECRAALADGSIGGAAILRNLSEFAYDCIDGQDRSSDAVAYAVGAIFQKHADNRDGRAVPADETARFIAAATVPFSEAVDFVETGGSADEAVRIIASLTRLLPRFL
jgi:hypothetical protein